jgi:VanZ family protein
LLTALWVWALTPALGARALAAAALIAFLYAISDEWHQSYVPGRDSDPVDVLVDTAGIAIAVLSIKALRGRARRRAASP